MKSTINNPKTSTESSFFTGVRLLVDRRIGAINLLSNEQILGEKPKLKNVRNGKVRLTK